MNILYLISYAGRAGTEKYVENLMRTYSAQGHDCFLAYMEGGELAERLAIKHGSNHVFDYMKLADDYAIYEISVPESWVGKTIVGKAIRQKYQISILATKENGHIYPLPSPDHVFKQNETLMIMGHQKDVQAITK